MSGKQLSSNELLAFQAISSFIGDVNTVFGSSQRSLGLYARLIEKTTFKNVDAIRKHILAFKKFCIESRNGLKEQNADNLSANNISYSERVYINVKQILRKSDRQSSDAVWQHLRTISAICDPQAKMKEVLQSQPENSANKSKDFLQGLLSKVEDNIDKDATNPTEAVSKLMSSGVMEEMMTEMSAGMQNGDLNLGSLMGSIQGMVSNIQGEVPPEMQNTMNGLTAALSQAQHQIENKQDE
jgi:hypothetical protein